MPELLNPFLQAAKEMVMNNTGPQYIMKRIQNYNCVHCLTPDQSRQSALYILF